ncbi:MAG: outer membrane beta-barrel protein, partial [Acetobacteraceae bacterium]|nr:outer membrane beta-barrel protein [Acetobacteraceae bacterium]
MPSFWNAQPGFAGALVACTLTVTLMAAPARAQLIDRFIPGVSYGLAAEPDVTVLSRARTDYRSAGIPAGAFTIRPSVTESFGYESNVLGLTKPVGSPFLQTDASLGAESANSRGSVSAALGVSDFKIFDLPSQSFTNWNVRLGGTYNLGRDSASVAVSHENSNQTVRDLDVPQLGTPLAYAIDTMQLGYSAVFSRISITPNVQVARFSYNSGSAGTTFYDQSYRNRVAVTPGVIASYEFATRRSVVLVVRNTTAFYARGSASNPRQNFNDTSILGGIDYDLTGYFRARALVGYETRSFSSKAYQTIQAPIAELSLI